MQITGTLRSNRCFNMGVQEPPRPAETRTGLVLTMEGQQGQEQDMAEAERVLYYARAVHEWQPPAGKEGLTLHSYPEPTLLAVVQVR